MKKTSHLNDGFTLIEIMVVISIIASLASVVLVGIKAAQASGRDSARNSNALQVRNALALYETDHGGVPAGSLAAGCTLKTINGTQSWDCKKTTVNGIPVDAVTNILEPALVPAYISHIPVDMINTNGLTYEYITAAADPALTSANNNIPTANAASFGFVSEIKSPDPVNDPSSNVIITVPVGPSNFSSYPDTGYPVDIYSNNNIQNLVLSGPSTLVSETQGTWIITADNSDNKTINYTLSWLDGTPDSTITSTNSSISFTHTYTSAGPYILTVVARTSDRSASATTNLTVTAPAPAFTISGPVSLLAGTPGSWTFSYPAGTGTSLNYRINLNWGDSTSKSALGGTTTAGYKTLSHTYNTPGTYTMSNTVAGITQTYIVTVTAHDPFTWASSEGPLNLCLDVNSGCSVSDGLITGDANSLHPGMTIGATEYCQNINTGDGRVWRLPGGGELMTDLSTTFGYTLNGYDATGLPGGFQQDKYYWTDHSISFNRIAIYKGIPNTVSYADITPNRLELYEGNGNVSTGVVHEIHTRCVTGEYGY